ncbi:bcs1 aaa-type ATPase, putative [Perkinsus marinus ATCC 50983]|uniref:Bcs1 aaa-type ATPase, putative n=1 Tax=Perkinsus marinus (strain ATCC 50983 / TXsc) TaxID=423536 RepID=C5LCI1_PERM5|nr:bcs1 aaa-type ATPase, putative [Perkinsus marinus ATCC 50983]EER05664.1 bcs1 aaa-type ATPase, putative [Perkinsus marinus ATCC 50983]|eukprot:XP_002773848.1 bcs1 aaa-type ATPase, putative [Perkinsus marinus ATCC 50983]
MDDIQDAVNSGVNMGLTSLLRSGNKYRDLALCIAVPIAMKVITDRQVLIDVWDSLKSTLHWVTARPDEFIREISFLEGQNLDTDNDDSSVLDTTQRNNILQKALRLYIEEKYHLGGNNMEVFLVAHRTIKLEKDRYGDAVMFTGNAQQLQSYEVTRLPSKGHWVLVDEVEDIWFKQEEIVDNVKTTKSNGDYKTTTNNKITSFFIKSRGLGAGDRVDGFIGRAYDWYVRKKLEEADGSRYFYIRTKEEDEFKKYRLSDCKSFDSLFFPEKDSLIRLVDDFVHKRGKFAISGFPNKLGLLLDGPPGTGKTSLIKALAQYTNRNVVCVSLEKVMTNQELMDILFDLSFPVKGDDEPPKLDFADIIFVMEDVDAASKVVYSRGSMDKEGAHREDLKDTPTKPSEDSMSEAATGSVEDSQPSMERLIHAVTTGVLAAKNISDDRAPSKGNADVLKDTGRISLFDDPDKLSLSGLLNALDGIVDSPGRILVMTTNHPERLDPALIRPGRINKRIHMGWMMPDMAAQMLSHYLSVRPSPEEEAEIEHMFGSFNISPATLEQTCAEFDTIGEVLESLKLGLELDDEEEGHPSHLKRHYNESTTAATSESSQHAMEFR